METDAPLISVIIPAFNAERTVAAAISSVLEQTHHNVEVIVVDDGSHDLTPTEIDAMAARDSRVRRITQRNQGVSGARNRGIDEARGLWIALLDADDTFAENRLSRLLRLADERAADMLADNLSVKKEFDAAAAAYHAFPEDRMALDGPIDPMTFVRCDRPRWGLQSAGFIKPLIRREFLSANDLRYPAEISAGEDFYFYLMCLVYGAKMHFVPDALYQYTLRSESLSHGDDDRVIAQYVSASRELKREATLRNLTDLVAELEQRERDMVNWLAFLSVTREFEARHYLNGFRALLRLPSPADGLRRLAAMARYNTAERLGITLHPKLPKA